MIQPYNRDLATQYAQTWALNKNPEFYYFGGIGGDCTNFISQCLLAGGGVMNYSYYNGWFYNSVDDRSPSWTGVGFLLEFLLRKNQSVGPFGSICKLDEAEIGDIIQLRQNDSHFNHSLIISQIVNKEIYVCAHSDSALNRPLKDYFYFDLMPIKINGILVDK